MSINDLLESEDFIPALFVIFVLIMIVAIPMGIAMSKKTDKDIYGGDEYSATKMERGAKIVARRTSPHPYSPTVMINMVVFELSSGSRIELAIKDPNIYGVMVEGDYGTLKYQGKKFISFERGNGNEA